MGRGFNRILSVSVQQMFEKAKTKKYGKFSSIIVSNSTKSKNTHKFSHIFITSHAVVNGISNILHLILWAG